MTRALLFLPEIATLCAMIVLLCLSLCSRQTRQKAFTPILLILGVLITAASAYSLCQAGGIFHNTYRIDLLSQSFKLALSLSFLTISFIGSKNETLEQDRRTEYGVFLVTGLLGMMMLTSAVDLLILYVSLELSAYSLYLLSALRRDSRVAEASSKYLILGAATSGFLLWGMSLVTGIAGSTNLYTIAGNISALSSQPAFWLGFAFMLLSILFKLSSAPLHFWAPDVYEASATPVTAFIATASKAAAVAILIRVLMVAGVSSGIMTILAVLAFVSMTLGNTVALVQTDVKRLLAYSSIAQAGYLLVGLLAGSFEGYSSSFFYAIAYLLMNTAAFFTLIFVAREVGNDNPKVSDFDGLAERSPFLALILLISLLSLAGIPPLVGFTGKWILFSAAMDKGHWFLVLWGVLNSVVSLFYYLTLVKHAYLGKAKNSSPIAMDSTSKILGLGLFSAIVVLGFFPNPLIDWVQHAVQTAWLS